MESPKIPIVSFIIPAFNAEEYISRAVKSIQNQTIKDWEIIIIDDGSTDRTLHIAQELASQDSRIHIFKMPHPSGSAYQPRKFGITRANAALVSPLDADDFVEETYLEELLNTKSLTGAQAVYPTMYSFSENQKQILLPKDKSFLDRPFPGKECLKFTLFGWQIGLNGGIIDKELYEKAFAVYDSDISYTFADELLGRQLLFLSPEVAFSSAKYYYYTNPSSITRTHSLKQFDYLFKNLSLLDFIKENYTEDSEEYIRAHRQNLFGIIDALNKLNRENFSIEIEKEVYQWLIPAKRAIDYKALKGKESAKFLSLSRLSLPQLRLILKSYDHSKPLLRLLFRYPKKWVKKSMIFLDKINQIRLLSKGEYPKGSWMHNLYERNYQPVTKLPEKVKEGYICVYNGKMFHGGITDRLRGILSIYSKVKKKNKPFYIAWTQPFPLEHYLVPAGFDWRIDPEEVIYDSRTTFAFINEDESNFHSGLKIHYGLKQFKPQVHVYSNADNSIGNYKELFHEVFQPSEALKREVLPHKKALGEHYDAYTFRFLQLLGDFKDWASLVLPEEEAAKLMERCYKELLSLAEESDAEKILITSDSKRFLDYIKDKDQRFYVVPGEVKNIDMEKGIHKEAWMKTFVDQQLLMGANRVVLMRTGKMYKSGFPRFAAEIGGIKFIDHKF